MQDAITKLNDAIASAQAAVADLNDQVAVAPVKSTGDQVLEAIAPVLVAAGWTAPAELPAQVQ